MGKKGAPPPQAASPTPEDEPKKDEPASVQLDGEFKIKDGSVYSGQYLKTGDDVCIHGEGELTTGPETFKGTFENGAYKEGRYAACSGATYQGAFKNGLYHGYGEYNWPDGRAYKGMWKDGYMHGRGCFLNFSFGVDNKFFGFSINGQYASNREEQEQKKKEFLSLYFSDYTESASSALRDLASKATPEGSPKEFFYPPLPADGEDEPADVKADRKHLDKLILGPHVECSSLQQSAAQAFVARLEDGAEHPLQIRIYEDRRATGMLLHMDRLERQQLQDIGQCVEFFAKDAEPGSVSGVVLLNASREYDVALATWKVVHVEVAA